SRTRTVSASFTTRVVVAFWTLNAGATMPLPRLTGVGHTVVTSDSILTRTVPSGWTAGVSLRASPANSNVVLPPGPWTGTCSPTWTNPVCRSHTITCGRDRTSTFPSAFDP